GLPAGRLLATGHACQDARLRGVSSRGRHVLNYTPLIAAVSRVVLAPIGVGVGVRPNPDLFEDFLMLRDLSVTRRGFFLATEAVSASVFTAVRSPGASPDATKYPQRVCVVPLYGFGTDYLEQSPMSTLKAWVQHGFFKRIRGSCPRSPTRSSRGCAAASTR